MKEFNKKHKIQLKLILSLVSGIVVLALLFYSLIPKILNYPEGTYNSAFQAELENTNYTVQALLMAFAIFGVFAIIVFFQTRFLITYQELFRDSTKYGEKEIRYVRDKLYNAPYTMYILNIIAPSLVITFIHAFTIKQLGITTLKIFILMFSSITIFASGILLYTKKLFKPLLLKLPTVNEICYKRVSIRYRFFYHILPLLIVGILFTALLGYSRVIVEKGNSIFEIYKERLSYYARNVSSKDELLNVAKKFPLYNEKDRMFIKKPDGTYINTNEEVISFSPYFVKYLTELSAENDGRVYEYYGVDAQGCVKDIKIENEIYTLGVYYEVASTNLLYYFLISFISMLIIDSLVLYLFANAYSSDIKLVADSFDNMTKQGKEKVVEKLAVVSNDEVGDLCIAFNKVQELTEKYIEQIHSSQDILIERERLASLGQMIGGIAHNLKTPIMSISGAAEGLTDLIKEYDASIGDSDVTQKDHHDIAKDMQVWVDKLKDYTAYMSDIITAVKGQAVTLSNEQSGKFTIEELVKRVDILMKHELKNALVLLNTQIEVNPQTELEGNVNSLVQVINNMISNGIQSYNGMPNGEIDMIISNKDDNIVISIRDYGSGLTKEVEQKLFKEMITTKGKNGTGLGLFMSYSNIRAHFNGNITFETEQGKGTVFYITIPLN